MSDYWIWWIAAAVLVGAELLTGTFYLLAVGVARRRRRRRRVAGRGAAGAVRGRRRARRRADDRRAPLAAARGRCRRRSRARRRPGGAGRDWNADGTARVAYRGSKWDAELAAPDTPRAETMYIVATRGSMLVLSDRPPARDAARTDGGARHVDRLVAVHARAVRRRGHRHRQGDPRRAAAARAGRRAAGPLLRGAGAGPQFRHPVRRPRRLPARPARDPARRAEPDLHHQGQHAAAGRRHPLLPGHRPQARVVRLEQLHASRSRSSRRRRCAA